MKRLVENLLRSDEGATMVEYAVMVTLIAAICVTVVQALGTQVKAAFTTVNTAITLAT